MTQEELDSRMQSIVVQQENTVRIVAGIVESQNRLDKRQVEFDARMGIIASRQQTNSEEIHLLTGMMRDGLARQDKMEEQQRVVNDALIALMAMAGQASRKAEESQKATEARIEESQKATETQLAETRERLDIFINVLERYISESRNGNKPNQQ